MVGKLNELAKFDCKFDELAKLDGKLVVLAKRDCKLDELAELRMSSMSWKSWTVSSMGWIR